MKNKYKLADDEMKRIERIISGGKIAEAKHALTAYIYDCSGALHGIPENGLVAFAYAMDGKRQVPVRNPRTRNALLRRLNKAKALSEKLHGHYVSY